MTASTAIKSEMACHRASEFESVKKATRNRSSAHSIRILMQKSHDANQTKCIKLFS